MRAEVLDRSTWTPWSLVTPDPLMVTSYEGLVGSPSRPGFLPLTLIAARAQPALRAALSSVIEGDTFHGVVHLAEVVTASAPLRSDGGLRCRSQLVTAVPTARGVSVEVNTEHANTDGTPIGRSCSTLLLLGEPIDRRWRRSGEEQIGPAEGGGGSLAELLERDLAPDLATRYAEISGDDNPIHLDDDAARAAGFPSAILHGMCAFAIAVSALAASFEDEQIPTSAATRFARPVTAGERLRISFASRNLERGRAIRFRAESKAGTALRSGHVTTQCRP